MALTIKGVPDARFYLGVDGILKAWALVPGTNDYPSPGGYSITAASVELVRIWGVSILGVVQPTSAVIYYPQITLATAATPVGGLTTFNLQFWVATTGAEAGNNVNLAGAVITVGVFGY